MLEDKELCDVDGKSDENRTHYEPNPMVVRAAAVARDQAFVIRLRRYHPKLEGIQPTLLSSNPRRIGAPVLLRSCDGF